MALYLQITLIGKKTGKQYKGSLLSSNDFGKCSIEYRIDEIGDVTNHVTNFNGKYYYDEIDTDVPATKNKKYQKIFIVCIIIITTAFFIDKHRYK